MSAANILGGLLFGSIGFIAFVYGKKSSSFRAMLIGGALMAFPYFVQNTAAMFAVGAALIIALFLFRD